MDFNRICGITFSNHQLEESTEYSIAGDRNCFREDGLLRFST